MALMYDMETVNRAMTEAAKLYDPKQKSIRVKRVLDIFAGMKPVEAEPVATANWYKGAAGFANCGRCNAIINPHAWKCCPVCMSMIGKEAEA